MRILLFGTYDTSMHPRVATVAEGLRGCGFEVAECNAPLGLNTAARVDMLAPPWRAPALLARLARRWATLARAARRMPAPDVVLVGYLGHFDVHLARLIFRRIPVVLDHLVGASETGRDRRLAGGPRQALLRADRRCRAAGRRHRRGGHRGAPGRAARTAPGAGRRRPGGRAVRDGMRPRGRPTRRPRPRRYGCRSTACIPRCRAPRSSVPRSA